MKMDEILVPMDFSNCALMALSHALWVAQKLRAKIVLLHVLELPNILPMGALCDGSFEQEARAKTQALLDGLMSKLSQIGATGETVILPGSRHETILKFVRDREIGIVIMGQRHHKAWQMFHRHTARRVKMQAPCLVQVLCEDAPFENRGFELPPIDLE